MSRSRRRNIDKKSGKVTTAGNRNGHEKHCRDDWCPCGGKKVARAEHKQVRQSFKQGDGSIEKGEVW